MVESAIQGAQMTFQLKIENWNHGRQVHIYYGVAEVSIHRQEREFI